VTPDLDGIAGMTQEEFSRRFAKSPIKRTKLAGLARNADIIRTNTQNNKGTL